MTNIRPGFDKEITAIADYVVNYRSDSKLAYATAHLSLLDALACSFLALANPHCTRLLGPIVAGAELTNGARVPGTHYQLEPVQAAFNIGTLIRWLDFNDTWLAAEWGHPSDNLGGILAIADYINRQHQRSLTMREVLTAMIKAYEIQGIMALENSFNRVGLDHVILVKIATTAVVTHLLGGDHTTICNAISLAWIDGHSLRTYRHAPNTGSRKSWAAGDATSRAVRLALLALTGEMGYRSALSAPTWGFYDATFHAKHFKLPRAYASYVIENILFKITFPAEFHAQTAVECAFTLHSRVRHRLADIAKVQVKTQESALRIIDKKGPLYNPADRDHCLQYMIAIGLIYGELNASHYEDEVASDPRIDTLRQKMHVSEEPYFSADYLDPDKRAIGNALQVYFTDGSHTEEIAIDYPIGHRRRRAEGIPLLMQKFERSVHSHFEQAQADNIVSLCSDAKKLAALPVDQFMQLVVK